MILREARTLDFNDVDLMEFQRLRNEIDNRTIISESIILAHITALGTGLSLLGKVPDILLALSYISSLLWLSWLAHTHQIYKLSGYIATELAPKLPSRADRPALYWEAYSRLVDWLGRGSYQFTPQGRWKEIDKKLNNQELRFGTIISSFIALLFGAPPLILLGAYTLYAWKCPRFYLMSGFQNCCAQSSTSFLTGMRIFLIIVSGVVWLAAICRHCGLRKTQWAIDKAVINTRPAAQDSVEKE